ncbi:hypothetical protein Pan97_42450 [Bremerella volcania]|uniref:Uncharacterized protein n=1 Tax=Bremerella volcania TaxID=2527984 RepID=A0A518CD85_9BACT|nr:hypothetical protein Pan97_42450 [Bremerella volcania]
MEQILEQYGTLITIFSMAVTVITSLTAIYLWFNPSKARKRLFVTSRHLNLIHEKSDSFPDISISFKGIGETLQNVSVTTFWIWCQNSDITKADFAKNGSLKIQAEEDAEILSCSVIRQSHEGNAVCVQRSQDRKQISVSFDHLNENEGAEIRVFHTARSNGLLNATGKIRGGEIVQAPNSLRRKHYVVPSIITIPLILISLAIPFARYLDQNETVKQVAEIFLYAFVGLQWLVWGTLIIRIYLSPVIPTAIAP